MRHPTALSGLVVALVGALVATPAGPAFAGTTTQPPSGKVGAEILTVDGNACTAGGTTIAMKPDNTGFAINLPPITARTTPGTTTVRRSCQITVQLRVPHGYTYRIAEVAAQGSAHLKTGANAVLKLTDAVADQEPVALLKRTFAGPLDVPWDAGSEQRTLEQRTADTPTFVPCGAARPVQLSIDLRVSAGATTDAASTSVFSVGYQDIPRADPGIRYLLDWRACSATGV